MLCSERDLIDRFICVPVSGIKVRRAFHRRRCAPRKLDTCMLVDVSRSVDDLTFDFAAVLFPYLASDVLRTPRFGRHRASCYWIALIEIIRRVMSSRHWPSVRGRAPDRTRRCFETRLRNTGLTELFILRVHRVARSALRYGAALHS